MADESYTPAWGASVEEVSALAPHVGIVGLNNNPPAPVDPVYGGEATGRIQKAQVEEWIAQIDARVSIRLHRFPRLKEGTRRSVLKEHCKGLVCLGAGALMVAAAHPSQAGINDNTSYAGKLWQQFLEGLDELEKALDGIIDDGGDDVIVVYAGTISSSFPRPVFRDRMRW